MSISLPFEKQEFAKSFGGKKMVLARNILPSVKVESIGQIVFGENAYFGDLKGLFAVEDGQLTMSDEWGKPLYSFRGAETRNGSTFMVGEPHMEAHFSGFVRCLLYEYKPLSSFKVCVSTHKDYTADTMPRLLRSLARAKVSKDDIIVVVGGTGESKETVVDGVKTILIKENYDGLTALTALSQDYSGYWLLLHDTCEAMDDFKDRMAKLDVGLNIDLLTVAGDIGLYSSAFVKRLLSLKAIELNADVSMIRRLDHCRLWSDCETGSRHVATKDVYGTGTQRDVLYLDDIGVKKYRRVKGAPAKP